ncbi:MAG: glutathione S-transferase family protein [Novosphingobium sp.]
MLLYDHPLSPYAQKVRILLREKGLSFDVQTPEGLGSGVITDFAMHNPRMEVPALVVEGHTICDSTIIMEFLEDRYPETSMMPTDPFERAQCRETEEICDTLYEANNWGLLEVGIFGRGGDIADKLRASAVREISTLNAWLESRLSENGWLSGTRYGHADIAAIPYVVTAAWLGIAPKPGSPLAGWRERTSARPAVAETLAEAKAGFDAMGQYSTALESGVMRRQYRDHRLEWTLRAGGLSVLLEGLERDNVRFTDIGLFAV